MEHIDLHEIHDIVEHEIERRSISCGDLLFLVEYGSQWSTWTDDERCEAMAYLRVRMAENVDSAAATR